MYFGTRIAVLRPRTHGFTITGKLPARQRRRYLSVGFCGWKGSGAARKIPWMRTFLKNLLQLVFIRYVLAPRKRRRWRWGSASAAPDKASHSLVVFPLVIQMWGCLWAAEAELGVVGKAGACWGTQVPTYPPHLSVTIRTAKNVYKIPRKKPPALL